MQTLRDAVVGKYYIVKKINGSGPLKRRIMDMGITKNADIYKKGGTSRGPRTN